jgi:hypothetical protein
MKSVAFVLALSGCAFDYDPDVGPETSIPVDGSTTDGNGGGAAFGCNNADSNPAVSVSFALNIRPLQGRTPGGCSPCHLGRVTSGFDQSSYASLRRGGINSGTRVIIPFEPCNSIIFQKLGRTPPFGSRMPFNGPPYFTAEERQIVHDWIAEGALNN